MEVHIKANKSVYNYYNKTLRLFNKEYSYEAITYIKSKRFPE